MNVKAIERAIQVLCAEIQGDSPGAKDWQVRAEEELLHEACVCMFSSQMVFEVAEAAAQRLKDRGLLAEARRDQSFSVYEKHLLAALEEPLAVERAGKVQHVRPRFRNRLASLLATTVTGMHDQGLSLHKVLASCGDAREAREALIKHVWGFGPKQASLFLRRVGYCNDLAVLDTHILDYLRIARGIDPKRSALSRLTGYEVIEAEFQRVATEFGHPVGCVDLAMWVTMRVAKREAIL